MNHSKRNSLISLVSFTALVAMPVAMPAAWGQDYPKRTITMIVPFAPGGGTDTVGRIVAQQLTERLGQTVIVENRPGAGSQIGVDSVAKADPDGYTLLFGPADGLAILPALKRTPYDPVKDFAPIARIATIPFVYAVNAKVPATTMAELIAYGKANPGKITYGTPGVGSVAHLTGALLSARTGMPLVHVPYKGGGPALAGFMGGEIAMIIGAPRLVQKQAEAGQARILAQTGAERHSLIPQIPTTAEAGIPDMVVVSWFGVLGPAKLPTPIVTRIASELAVIVAKPEMQKRLVDASGQAALLGPAAFAKFIADDLARWTAVAKAANISLQN